DWARWDWARWNLAWDCPRSGPPQRGWRQWGRGEAILSAGELPPMDRGSQGKKMAPSAASGIPPCGERGACAGPAPDPHASLPRQRGVAVAADANVRTIGPSIDQ